MSMKDIFDEFSIKSIDNMKLSTPPDQKICKGRIYRCTISSFQTKYNSIEVRKSLRLLKRKSCSGCENCDWMDEYLHEDIYNDPENDYIGNLKANKMYKLIGKWHPGCWEYPDDGEVIIEFHEYKDD